MRNLGLAPWATLAALLWFLGGLARAARDRLARRFARWLLPPNQPATYRIAAALVWIAQAMGPYRIAPGVRTELTGSDPSRRREPWEAPRAARAELEADLREGRRTVKPVRFVLPVLYQALYFQFRNLALIAFYLVGFTVFVGAPILAVVIAGTAVTIVFSPVMGAVGLVIAITDRISRRRDARRATRQPE